MLALADDPLSNDPHVSKRMDSAGMIFAVRNLAAVFAATMVLALSTFGSAVAEPGYSFVQRRANCRKQAFPSTMPSNSRPISKALRCQVSKSSTSRSANPPRGLF